MPAKLPTSVWSSSPSESNKRSAETSGKKPPVVTGGFEISVSGSAVETLDRSPGGRGDIDNGPNALQDSPKLVTAVTDGTNTSVSGSINTRDIDRGMKIARKIRTGTLAVGGAQWFHVDTPFGGYKQSGVGRENGVLGFEEYLETKVIALPGRGSR